MEDKKQEVYMCCLNEEVVGVWCFKSFGHSKVSINHGMVVHLCFWNENVSWEWLFFHSIKDLRPTSNVFRAFGRVTNLPFGFCFLGHLFFFSYVL